MKIDGFPVIHSAYIYVPSPRHGKWKLEVNHRFPLNYLLLINMRKMKIIAGLNHLELTWMSLDGHSILMLICNET